MFETIFDTLFDGLAWLLALYYLAGHSFGFAIILFTLTVMLLLTPLTLYTTRSMLRMQAIQPQVKKLQTQFRGDRQRMNEEMMRLYRAHNVNPLGSCLPILPQIPVFFVLFRLIQGLTRRVSDLGVHAGYGLLPRNNGVVANPQFAERRFNPEYLATDSELRNTLEGNTEMNFLGIDLSATVVGAFRDSLTSAMPLLLLIVLIGVTSYVQQRQIAGRRDPDAPVNPQQQMIMRIMPWFLPLISLNFPAALNVYFVTSNVVRVGQQAVITRRIYRPHQERQALKQNKNDDDFDIDVIKTEATSIQSARQSRMPQVNHGSRRPTSRTPPRRRTDSRRVNNQSVATPVSSTKKADDKRAETKVSRSQLKRGSSKNGAKPLEQSQSSRTTQKGHQSYPTDRRRQRKKRRK
ncbi:MAG: YidC/Oxa1 family membrane protein insertase [Acidimicrobiia bacterium]|nr:YidC/Oxa1 family membrane protein insertase [Acidimicrobiia bacterium]MYC57557.1 YidC/Oxa1 family membrane protein insertase [Acidimicrobiia bacterium]MYI30079.1 YidC/Oxa1 family membrane protein insertase [Acidimicrobiia bacterium]